MATVFLGTFYPLFAEVWSGVKLSVGPQYFDTTFVPILAPGIIAMVIGPVLAWRTAISGAPCAAWRRLYRRPARPGDRFLLQPQRIARRLSPESRSRSGPCSAC